MNFIKHSILLLSLLVASAVCASGRAPSQGVVVNNAPPPPAPVVSGQ